MRFEHAGGRDIDSGMSLTAGIAVTMAYRGIEAIDLVCHRFTGTASFHVIPPSERKTKPIVRRMVPASVELCDGQLWVDIGLPNRDRPGLCSLQ